MTAATPDPNAASSRTGVAAIVTYVLLAEFGLTIAAVVVMIGFGVKADAVLLALLSGMVGSLGTMAIGAVGFWIGSSVGAKASGDALAKGAKDANDALAVLATAGAAAPTVAAETALVVENADSVAVDGVKTKEKKP